MTTSLTPPALPELVRVVALGLVFEEAIGALPSGLTIEVEHRTTKGPEHLQWAAYALHARMTRESGYGPTPTAALQALTEKLRNLR